MLILIDQDNVLANFDKGMVDCFCKQFPHLPLNKERTKFYWADDYPEYANYFSQIYTTKGFFEHLEPMNGAIDAIKALLAFGHDVRICTSPISDYRHCVNEKFIWVEKHLGFDWTKRLILTKDKSWVRGDILIDDKPIITGSLTPTWTHWHYLHSYNAHLPNKKVVWTDKESWAELLK
ncbi:5' nucleotidase, NT5C type [Moraxella oblonga]|uniref:5' nucleotidase, NT5C type n=1 Tax=Moraxella oblonga TaxID=200413 RepID=UPI00082AFAA8|nr:5'-3'-deoxyribonucleotidase [Moraxella oblonga]